MHIDFSIATNQIRFAIPDLSTVKADDLTWLKQVYWQDGDARILCNDTISLS